MKKFSFFIVLILSFLLGQSQFVRMPLFYPQDSTLYSPNTMSIVDQDHVWIATQRLDLSTNHNYMPFPEALTTNDGGNTWHFYNIPATGTPLLLDVEAYSDSICYYFVDDFFTGHSDIWKTVNAGSSWSKKTTTQFSANYGDFIHLFSKDTLIAIGDPADGYFNIQITTDGGETWTRVSQSNIPAILPNEMGYSGKSYSAIGNTIWFPTSQGRCFKSTDKGYEWTVSNVDTSFGYQVPTVRFSDLQHGIFYCYGIIPIRYYRTFDGGETWTNFPILQNLFAPGISTVGGIFEGFVIAAGDINFPNQSYIYYTTDFFNTLTILDTVLWSSNFIYFKDAYTGWLARSYLPDSAIFKFTDVLTSIKNKPIVQGNIIITPNPTDQSSLLTFPSEFINENKILRVFSVSGKLMKEYTLPANVKSIELNAAGYSNGVYIIELISDTGLNKINRWVVIH